MTGRCTEHAEVQAAETACLSGYHHHAADCRQCAEGSRVMTGDQTKLSESRRPTACQERQTLTSVTTSKQLQGGHEVGEKIP